MKRIAVLVLSMLSIATATQAATIVPNSLAAVEGDSNNGYPFNITAHGEPTMRYQQVYGASEFSGSQLLTGISFRVDADTGSAFASVLPSLQIDLSTTIAGPGTLSNTFAANVGADNTTVFNGAANLSSTAAGPAAGPRVFDIFIPFTTAFLYDPALGNLLLDVRNFGGGTTTQFDAHSAADSIARLWGPVASLTAAGGDSSGLVTRFETDAVAAVPEPASLLLLGSGLAGLAARARRRTRKQAQ